MRRREFITLIGGAAAAWPFSARAQQGERVRRIGVLAAFAEDDPDTRAWLPAFRQGLERLGWSEGRNVRIDIRFARANVDRHQALAKELVALQPDVIVAQTTPVVTALQRESRTLPIVFLFVSDPVGSGLVASLARPGGNLTGLLLYEASIVGKWLAMLREIAPRMARAALVADPKTPIYDYFLRAAEAIAPSLAIELVPSPVETAADIERAIESFARAPNGGLFLPPNATIVFHRDLIIALAARDRLPAGSVNSLRLVVSCPTGSTRSTCGGKRRFMSTASCAAPIPPTFRFRRRPGTKRPSTSRQRRRSASTCRLRCSCAPTR